MTLLYKLIFVKTVHSIFSLSIFFRSQKALVEKSNITRVFYCIDRFKTNPAFVIGKLS